MNIMQRVPETAESEESLRHSQKRALIYIHESAGMSVFA